MRGALARLRFMADHRWSPRQMSEYLDGELRVRGRERMERHTRGCPECRALLAALREVISALGGLQGGPERTVAHSVLAGVQRGLAGAGGVGHDHNPHV